MYIASDIWAGTFGGSFAGIAASVRGILSSIVFVAGSGVCTGGRVSAFLSTAAFLGLSTAFFAANSVGVPPVNNLMNPKTVTTDASSITPFTAYSCSEKSVSQRAQNLRLVHNFHSALSIFSPQLQQ